MKNRWQDELRRELKPVRVDDSLKMRILARPSAPDFAVGGNGWRWRRWRRYWWRRWG